jgi:predicted Zn-dependent protease with MMP-like domain
MNKKKFEKLVEEALEDIPEEFNEKLENVTVIVEDRPSREVYERTGSSPYSLIFGLYHGVPFKHRGPLFGNQPPSVIVIYQEPIERIYSSEEEIKNKVAEVVKHEIAHHFGMDDPYLEEIEKEIQSRQESETKREKS